MHWVPTYEDEVYILAMRQMTLQDLAAHYARLQSLPAAQELPDRWLEPIEQFSGHLEGVMFCAMLHCAIEVDPRLRYLVVNGRQDTLRALLGLPPGGPPAIVEGGPIIRSRSVTSAEATVAPGGKRVRREKTMRQQMDEYNDLARYANSIGMVVRLLGGPNHTNTFATYDLGERATAKLRERIKEHEKAANQATS